MIQVSPYVCRYKKTFRTRYRHDKGSPHAVRATILAMENSRDALLSAWGEIGPSTELTAELQNLCLLFINRPSRHARSNNKRSGMPANSEMRDAPPQRYQRRVRAADIAPSGPCKPAEAQALRPCVGIVSCIREENGLNQIAAPNGPSLACSSTESASL
jgi:hypothetical protein